MPTAVPGYRGILERCVACFALWALLACARVPPAASANTGTLWGELHLVPRHGVVLPAARDPGYADPRYAQARLVDYSRPGFAVVYLDAPPARETALLSIRSTRLGDRIEPERAVVGALGSLEIANRSRAAHVVSCPELGLVRRLAPGEKLELAPLVPGALHVHLVGEDTGSATVFASPGPFAVVGEDARWQLTGLAPGRATLRAWHVRFPPLAREVEVRAGEVERIDLALGVDTSGAAP
jgi:hypothetical protein